MTHVYPSPEERERLYRWMQSIGLVRPDIQRDYSSVRIDGPLSPDEGFACGPTEPTDPLAWCETNLGLRALRAAPWGAEDREPLFLGGGQPLGAQATAEWIEREARRLLR